MRVETFGVVFHVSPFTELGPVGKYAVLLLPYLQWIEHIELTRHESHVSPS